MGPEGTLAMFLRDFGPALRDKYKPKGIVVFSAHWETTRVRHGKDSSVRSGGTYLTTSLAVTDYGDRNPLLMDYYGFEPHLYRQTFQSKGDRALAERVVQLYKEVY